jgi:2-aminoadipate transaminase
MTPEETQPVESDAKPVCGPAGGPRTRFSERSMRTGEAPIAWLMAQAVAKGDLISLAAGLVNYETLPVEETREVMREMLADEKAARVALQYGTTEGLDTLRRRVVDRLAAMDGGSCRPAVSPDDVIIGTGSQQLLYLLSELLLDEGDIVILDHPSYFVFMGALRSAGAACRSVPMDESGMRSDLLRRVFEELKREGDLSRVKLVYLMSYFQNPTGISIGRERRRELVDIIRRFSSSQRIHVVEDAAYRELRYDGEDVPSVFSLDDEGDSHVYLGTFSKPYSPGFKTGYAVLPHDLVNPLSQIKGGHDFGSNNFIQHVIDRVLAKGLYDRHVEKLRKSYRARRNVMLDALEREMPGGVAWTRPRGGLYVWLTLPQECATGPGSKLLDEAIREGMLYVPGEFCFAGDPEWGIPRNCIRLSFGVGSVEKIDEGIRRLGRAVRRCV